MKYLTSIFSGNRGGTIQEMYCDVPKKICDGHSKRYMIDGC